MSSQYQRRPAGLAARVEPLEGRALLAAGLNAFASEAGTIAARGERDLIPVEVRAEDFDLPGGRVLLGLAVHPTGNGRLDPRAARLVATPTGGGSVQAVLERSNTARDRASLTIASVGAGDYAAVIESERRTPGAYRLDLFLAGDADANHRVDDRDLALIRALQGARIGRRGYRVDADVDRNGSIQGNDLRLAARNLGAVRRATPPIAVTARLDSSSDPDGNNRVLRPEAIVVGQAAPGAAVLIDRGRDGTVDGFAVADPAGHYRIPVALAYGANPIWVVAVGAGGAISVADPSVDRSDVVLDWNEAVLGAIRADRTAPPRAARALAIVQIAVYDAVNAIDRSHEPYAVVAVSAPGASVEAAAASAAHRALVGLYPALSGGFDAALAATLEEIADGPAESAGIGLGRFVAERVLDLRRDDGADVAIDYTTPGLPGDWRPTPPQFADPLLPQWPFVRPFALARPDQFRAAPPPALTSAEYAADLEEVESLGRIDSTTRTAEQTLIARFWADGAGTATPPGHWNQIAQEVARQRGTTTAENARLFALLNIAMADAGISSWDTKYFYGVWRPITAIREADADGNPATAADPDWAPFLATPPFPTYTSGHSTFSGAGAEVLAFFFGPDTSFTTATDDLPGVVRSFSSFAQAADEAGRSRIYGGIHFEFDNEAGLAAGRAVGRHATRSVLT